MKNSIVNKLMLFGLALFLISGINAQKGHEKYDLLLKFGQVNVIENTDDYINNFDVSKQDILFGKFYKIIQFYTVPTNEQKQALENSGIEFLEYIPNKAYIVSIPADFEMTTLKEYNVRNISDIIDEFKQDTYILDKNYPSWALSGNNQIDIIVSYYRNLELDYCYSEISPLSNSFIQNDEIANYQVLRVNINDLEKIVSQPYVYFVEPLYPEGEPENYTGKTLHRSNVLDSQYETGRHYDGTDVKVMLQDDGYIGPHIDYQGRIGAQNIPSNSGNHGDHCAGTIFGGGNLNPTTTGMAPGAELHTWGAAPLYPGFTAIPTAYTNTGIRISSTSYSNGCNAGYTNLARTMDIQVNSYESLMHVFSAGNSGTENCGYGAGAGWGNVTGGHKIGKNVIATANVDYTGSLSGSSSRGPAHDGRIKPDISAKGSDVYSTIDPHDYASFSGTSMACPGIAGSLAQLYQAYKELNNGNEPSGGFMKGLIMNTADDLGNFGPDFKYGWGHINNLKAVELLEEERYMTDNISQGETNNHTIDIPAGVKEVKVMVYWTDKEGTVNTSHALVNNLDIVLTDPSNGDHLPWVLSHYPHADSLNKPATKGNDDLNNVEQVHIAEPQSGSYTLTVDGEEIPYGPQEYYVYYDFIFDEITLTYPIGGESFPPGNSLTVRWDAFGDDDPFTVEYSLDGGSNWTVANSNINGANRHYNWSAPAEVSGNAMVRVSRNGLSHTSDEAFSIMGVTTDIEFPRACPNSVLLRWEAVNEAVSYDVYQLGDKYMEIVGSTTTDSLLVEGINFEDELWFSVAAVGPDNAIGRRANAEMKSPGVWNCIFNKDLALSDVISPPLGVLFDCQDYTDLNVQVELKNNGQDDITDITINYEFENDPVVTEVYTGTIAAGETMIYEFASTVSLPSNGIYDMKAWIEVTGDENAANNEVEGASKVKSSQWLNNNFVINFDEYDACSFDPDCEDITCYLDNKFYNMQNELNDDIDWRVLNGITPTTGTGPIGDHTSGTASGKFLYLEASGDCYEKEAILTTPCIELTNSNYPVAFFYFNLNGADMGSLHVDVISEGILHKDIMPPVSGNWGSEWHEAHAYLWDFAGKNITLRFRGYTGNGELSDMAIDDLLITEGTNIDENIPEFLHKVFPNPSEGNYNIVFNQDITSTATIRVIDVTGRTIFSESLDDIKANRSYSIDISAFDNGMYYLVLETENWQVKEKLLKH